MIVAGFLGCDDFERTFDVFRVAKMKVLLWRFLLNDVTGLLICYFAQRLSYLAFYFLAKWQIFQSILCSFRVQ